MCAHEGVVYVPTLKIYKLHTVQTFLFYNKNKFVNFIIFTRVLLHVHNFYKGTHNYRPSKTTSNTLPSLSTDLIVPRPP